MRTTLRHFRPAGILVVASTMILTACEDRSINQTDIRLSSVSLEISISDINNIIWTMNGSGYEPFKLIFNEARFFGYDGCNWFGGRFTAENDSIFPTDVGQTERGCNTKTFPVFHLAYPFRMAIGQNELNIFAKNNTILILRSNYTESIEGSLLLGNWILTASNDPELDEIQAQQLIPTLILAQNRAFRLTWYCVPENILGCDEFSGIFGISAGKGIQFYNTAWHGQSPGSTFMERILNTSNYIVETPASEPASLTLFNSHTNKSYEFTASGRLEGDF